MRLYLSGPMTGLPDDNKPAFNAEAARLRALGYDVFNPAEVVLPDGATWAQYMRIDLSQLLTCDEIAMLPGWESSKGANVEHGLAVDIGMPVHIAANLGREPLVTTPRQPATDWAAA